MAEILQEMSELFFIVLAEDNCINNAPYSIHNVYALLDGIGMYLFCVQGGISRS